MRIALFTDYFPPHVDGGVERVVMQLAQGYARRGHDVRVFTLNTREAPEFEASHPTCASTAPLPCSSQASSKSRAASRPGSTAWPTTSCTTSPADVIHAHTSFFYSSLVAAALSKRHGTPMVTTLHVGSLG